MREYIVSAALFLCSLHQDFANWSIIIIDPNTKEIGIAGALPHLMSIIIILTIG